jgi:serine/threonine kinase 32
MGCCFSEPVDFNAEVNLYHFELHRAVGRGAFGKVRVVEHKRTRKMYALKYIDKSRCIKQKAIANIIQERRLLEEIDHAFVVNLRYAFQDDENCFFVLDLMLGGDLRFHLKKQGPFSEQTVQFWTAELACAVQYLHEQRIVHRDIKPDNILLDSNGHAHITDFNVAIHFSERRLHTSVAGSMAYMAPQVVGRQGYSWQIDWWSLGITAYELLFNKRPFEGRTSDKMHEAILNDVLAFPEDATQRCSKACLSALEGFIERDPHSRLGCRRKRGFGDVKQHPWFSSINWDKLETKELNSPFVPDMQEANFDISHELDEFLMIEKPLTHTKRKANPDMEKMKPELRQLEEQFTLYDFSNSRRLTYYPHNQPVGSSEKSDQTLVQSITGTVIPNATIIERSQAGSPTTVSEDCHYISPHSTDWSANQSQ